MTWGTILAQVCIPTHVSTRDPDRIGYDSQSTSWFVDLRNRRCTMRLAHDRVAHLETHYRHGDLVAAIQQLLPLLNKRAELVTLYVLVCAFWGLLLYAAAQFALP